VKQKQDVHQRDQNHGLPECVFERVDGAGDQVAAVVEWLDGHALRQTGRDLRDARLHVLDHAVGVFARAHDDRAADDFVAIDVEGAPAVIAADLHGGDVAQVHGSASARGDGDLLDVGGALEEPAAAHDKLLAVFLEGFSAHVEIVFRQRVHHVG